MYCVSCLGCKQKEWLKSDMQRPKWIDKHQKCTYLLSTSHWMVHTNLVAFQLVPKLHAVTKVQRTLLFGVMARVMASGSTWYHWIYICSTGSQATQTSRQAPPTLHEVQPQDVGEAEGGGEEGVGGGQDHRSEVAGAHRRWEAGWSVLAYTVPAVTSYSLMYFVEAHPSNFDKMVVGGEKHGNDFFLWRNCGHWQAPVVYMNHVHTHTLPSSHSPQCAGGDDLVLSP